MLPIFLQVLGSIADITRQTLSYIHGCDGENMPNQQQDKELGTFSQGALSTCRHVNQQLNAN